MMVASSFSPFAFPFAEKDCFLEEVFYLDLVKSEEKVHRDLSIKEIFQRIKPLLCRVVDIDKTATGFFITNNGLLVTSSCFFDDGIEQHDQLFGDSSEEKLSDYIDTEYLTVEYQGQSYPVKARGACSPMAAKRRGVCLLQVCMDEGKIFNLGKKKDEFFVISKDSDFVAEGEEVYFGGFPLAQKTASFHKGFISSVSMGHVSKFALDATIVPGNLGAPIVLQKNGKLHLAGVVTFTIADLPEKFAITTSLLSQIANSEPPTIYRNATEEIHMGTARLIHTLLVALQNNLSTGVAEGVHASHLQDLWKTQTDRGFIEDIETKAFVTQEEITDFLHSNNWELVSEEPIGSFWSHPDFGKTLPIPRRVHKNNYHLIMQLLQEVTTEMKKYKLEKYLLDKGWRLFEFKEGFDIWTKGDSSIRVPAYAKDLDEEQITCIERLAKYKSKRR